MGKITSSEFFKSSSHIKECPPTDRPEIAFIGRSNVGKSSLINSITGRKALAKISGKPGKTRLINHFDINNGKWFLVDLPGYGWAQVSKTEVAKWEKMVHEYLNVRENLAIVFVLVDSRHEPQKSDLEMIHWLGENNIPLGILFTKADKLSNMQVMKNVRLFKTVLKQKWEVLPPIFITSASSGKGKEEVIDFIEEKCL